MTFLFVGTCLIMIIDNKISWFTRREVLDIIYHLFFYTTNSLEGMPTTFQYFQPLTLLTLALAMAAIHCMLFEYASAKMATVMFSADEYQGKLYPITVINFTLQDTAHIIHTISGSHHSLPLVQIPWNVHPSNPCLCFYSWCCTVQFPSTLKSYPAWCSSSAISTPTIYSAHHTLPPAQVLGASPLWQTLLNSCRHSDNLLHTLFSPLPDCHALALILLLVSPHHCSFN